MKIQFLLQKSKVQDNSKQVKKTCDLEYEDPDIDIMQCINFGHSVLKSVDLCVFLHFNLSKQDKANENGKL